MKNSLRSILNIFIGISLFIIISLLLPKHQFSLESRLALATLTLMIFWWITTPVHIAVTALIPIIVNSFFVITPMSNVLDDYFSPIVVLLIGASVLIASWINSGLDKRIALGALTIIGTSVKKQLFVWFVISTLFSTFLPNAVVAAMLCPIAVSMIKFSSHDYDEKRQTKTFFLILLAIVWGAGLGGFGTPLGGAMNLVAIKHIETLTGQEYMYITWTLRMIPYLVVVAAGACLYLMSIKTETKTLMGSKEYFVQEYKRLGKMSRKERISLILFLAAVLLAFTRPLYKELLPEFKPFYAFLLMGIAAFFIKDKDNNPLVSWNSAVQNINWGMIILFSGGLAIGNLIISTGAADAVANTVAAQDLTSIVLLIAIIVFLGVFLSNASSNTAATAVLVPVTISLAAAIKLEPLNYIYIAAAACNCAFILPTSIRAIPVGYGLDVRFMLKKGVAAVGISYILLVATAYIMTQIA